MDFIVDQVPYIPDSWRPSLKWLGMEIIMWADWAVSLRNPQEILGYHSTEVIHEYFFYIIAFLMFLHSCRKGGRYFYTWIAIVIYGLTCELICYNVHQLDVFWHAQSSVMLFGRRLPLHIAIAMYPVLYYPAYCAARRLGLSLFGTAAAAGLLTVLIDIPYDILGIKLLWWTWHDTDPAISDRSFYVPYTSYIFHLVFGATLTVLLAGFRKMLLPADTYDWKLFAREFIAACFAGMLVFPIGALLIVPVYHIPHDIFGAHTSICMFSLIGLFSAFLWVAKPPQKKTGSTQWLRDGAELILVVILCCVFFCTIVKLADPSMSRSIGLHQPIGNCATKEHYMHPLIGKVERNAYLCGVKYHEPYFDFNCALAGGEPPKKPKVGQLEWYVICGNAFRNKNDYVGMVFASSFFIVLVYLYCFIFNGPAPDLPVKVYKRKRE